ETSGHLLLECEAYEEERGELRRHFGERGEVWDRKSFVETEESFEIFRRAVRTIGLKKEEDDREELVVEEW
ncbi:hypothetical protein J6590_074251, partial [Homalodisca vitripennis]